MLDGKCKIKTYFNHITNEKIQAIQFDGKSAKLINELINCNISLVDGNEFITNYYDDYFKEQNKITINSIDLIINENDWLCIGFDNKFFTVDDKHFQSEYFEI